MLIYKVDEDHAYHSLSLAENNGIHNTIAFLK
jgi:hypothetical protein